MIGAQGFLKLVVVIRLSEGSIPAMEVDMDGDEAGEGESDGVQDNVLDEKADQELSSEVHRPTIDEDDVAIGAVPDPDDPGGNNQSAESGEDVPSNIPALPSPASSRSSTTQDYVNFLSDDPTPWVGQISGTIELFRYNATDGTAFRDGPKLVSHEPPDLLHPHLN